MWLSRRIRCADGPGGCLGCSGRTWVGCSVVLAAAVGSGEGSGRLRFARGVGRLCMRGLEGCIGRFAARGEGVGRAAAGAAGGADAVDGAAADAVDIVDAVGAAVDAAGAGIAGGGDGTVVVS